MTDTSPRIIAPGGRIGILGGGQLGRMLALAAARLGLDCHIFDQDRNAPAARVSAAHTVARFDDTEALQRFAREVDVVTLEFENVPVAALETISTITPTYPGTKALGVAQDRVAEKSYFQSLGIGTAPFAAIASDQDLIDAVSSLGTPCILKTRRFGYDGQGQRLIRAANEAAAAWDALGRQPAILEGFAAFEREVSVIAARSLSGDLAVFPVSENIHRHHILDETIAPAVIPDDLAVSLQQAAERILQGLDYVGVGAVEFFLMPDGQFLANEMAPRVHNSGHWTMDGAHVCQFEQHIRAICGWPLGDTRALGQTRMKNLLGDDIVQWQALAADPRARLHLYGKAEARPGRKMGHVTWLMT